MRCSTLLLLVFSAFIGHTKALEVTDRETSQAENDLTGRHAEVRLSVPRVAIKGYLNNPRNTRLHVEFAPASRTTGCSLNIVFLS